MIRQLSASFILLVCLASLAVAQVKGRVRVSESFADGMVVKKAPPEYPALARKARLEGTVLIMVKVSKTGDVEDIQLISGHPILATAAVAAVKQWKYRPYLMQDLPVPFETRVSLSFVLPPESGTQSNISGGVPPGQSAGTADIGGTEGVVPGQWVRVSAGVESGMIVKKVQPVYPQNAKHAHIQGIVTLNAQIDKQGDVVKLDLISGHPELVTAAMDAVKQWKYRPFLLNGEPRDVETQVQVSFVLIK
jgi:TonB family protein